MEKLQEINLATGLSVIIPTYNGERFIAAALDALLCSTHRPSEVLLYDDGSTDRTLEIAHKFASDLPLRIEVNVVRGNWVRSTNKALARASGEFVTFLHQDDVWLPNRLERFYQALALPGVFDVFLNASYFVDDAGTKSGLWSAPLTPGLNDGLVVARNLIIQNFIAMPGVIFRRHLLQRELESGQDVLDESLWYTADWDLWLTLASRSAWFYDPEPRTCFRIHSESLTAKSKADSEFQEQFIRVITKHYPRLKIVNDPGLERLAWFSVKVNIFLARLFQRERPLFLELLLHALQISPRGLARYWHVSRIRERVASRIKVFGKKSMQKLMP